MSECILIPQIVVASIGAVLFIVCSLWIAVLFYDVIFKYSTGNTQIFYALGGWEVGVFILAVFGGSYIIPILNFLPCITLVP